MSSNVSKGGTDGHKVDSVLHLPQPQSLHNLSLNGVLVYLPVSVANCRHPTQRPAITRLSPTDLVLLT